MKHFFNTRRFALLLLNIFAPALFCCPISVNAQAGAIGLDPTRIEVVIPAGTEKTVGATVGYSREIAGVELPPARLISRMEDWTITPDGDVKFAPVNTLERSAASWVTASTSELTLAPETQKVIRFTVSVPKNTAPGDYYFAAYVESRDAPPPPKEGEKRITISFRNYLMVYVLVPGLTFEGELRGLATKVINGIPVVSPTLGNKGNSRLRPKHSFEIRDSADRVVFDSQPSEARVLLGGHSWQMPYIVDAKLPIGLYKVAYKVDFGDKKAVQIGRTTFEITEADIAARKGLENQVTAERPPPPPPQNIEPEKAGAASAAKEVKENKTEPNMPQAPKTGGDAKPSLLDLSFKPNESVQTPVKKP